MFSVGTDVLFQPFGRYVRTKTVHQLEQSFSTSGQQFTRGSCAFGVILSVLREEKK
jgi:hypothetical protein